MQLIQTEDDLSRVIAALEAAPLFAADSEAAGFHRYSDTTCLMQISTRQSTWLIDALAFESLDGLAEFFADPRAEVVFHDADFDLRILSRDFGIRIGGLFDTKIAADLLGVRAPGLANLLESYLGVDIGKKFQRADWSRRPLPQDMLEYAVEDTRHLPELRDRLREQLVEKGRLHWAEEEFREREKTRWTEPEPDPNAFRIKRSGKLDPRGLAVLREAYDWRDEEARRQDRAPFRVLSNTGLLAIAEQRPRSARALADTRGVPGKLAGQRGAELVERIERAIALPEDELPPRRVRSRAPRAAPEVLERTDRLKSVRNEAAEDLALDPGVLMPNRQLARIAAAVPSTAAEISALGDIRDWQAEVLGERILNALDGQASQGSNPNAR